LHDLGKIGVPDAILNKPGKHTPDEWEIMKSHALLGYEMLNKSERRILQAGALLARDHHERWEGGGYPYNKSGDDIHIYGRITAVADVFDALGSDRCYKKAWPIEKILDLMRAERGKQFEPVLIDSLLNNIDKVIAIRDAYADKV
jgi:response regulator RpfG family c-di-GMP phosphodiesterase